MDERKETGKCQPLWEVSIRKVCRSRELSGLAGVLGKSVFGKTNGVWNKWAWPNWAGNLLIQKWDIECVFILVDMI